jgi:hypothetical protein
MNETSPNPSPITWPDLPVTATFSRVSSLVDGYSLQVAGRECATLLFLRDDLAGLVDVHFASDRTTRSCSRWVDSFMPRGETGEPGGRAHEGK